jgi:hypothetical protein
VKRIPAAYIHASSNPTDPQKLILPFQQGYFSTSFPCTHSRRNSSASTTYHDNFCHRLILLFISLKSKPE